MSRREIYPTHVQLLFSIKGIAGSQLTLRIDFWSGIFIMICENKRSTNIDYRHILGIIKAKTM